MKKRNIAVIVLVAVLLAVGFALPDLALALRDASLEGRDRRVAVDTTPVGALAAALTAEDKVRLAGHPETVEFVPLSTGARMTEPEARRTIEAMMEKLSSALLYPRTWTCQEIDPLLAVGSDGRSFVVWRAYLTADAVTGELTLDDETERALSFAFYGEKENKMEPAEDQEPDGDAFFDLALRLLEPMGLVPYAAAPDLNGGEVLTREGDLSVRITVTTGNWPTLRVNC